MSHANSASWQMTPAELAARHGLLDDAQDPHDPDVAARWHWDDLEEDEL